MTSNAQAHLFRIAVRIAHRLFPRGASRVDRGGLGHGADRARWRRRLEIIAKAIAEAGLGLQSVIRTRVMLTDISRWEEAARAHGEMFAGVKPASTFVEVKGLINREWLVEIEADCVDTR